MDSLDRNVLLSDLEGNFNPPEQPPSHLLHSSLSVCSPVPEDLSHDERDELSNIRRRKKELLDDIEVGAGLSPVLSCPQLC